MSKIIGSFLTRVGLNPMRFLSQKPKKPKPKKKKAEIKETMIDPMEHATGIEKRELMAYAKGCDDPFLSKRIMKRGPGTKEAPNLIPSAFEGRIVGCCCNKNRFIQWMWLERGCPKRCECGFWFKLQEVEPF